MLIRLSHTNLNLSSLEFLWFMSQYLINFQAWKNILIQTKNSLQGLILQKYSSNVIILL